jgi:hypothetical protein
MPGKGSVGNTGDTVRQVDVVADMLPAERGDVDDVLVGSGLTVGAPSRHSPVQIYRILEDDGGDGRVEFIGVAMVLKRGGSMSSPAGPTQPRTCTISVVPAGPPSTREWRRRPLVRAETSHAGLRAWR